MPKSTYSFTMDDELMRDVKLLAKLRYKDDRKVSQLISDVCRREVEKDAALLSKLRKAKKAA